MIVPAVIVTPEYVTGHGFLEHRTFDAAGPDELARTAGDIVRDEAAGRAVAVVFVLPGSSAAGAYLSRERVNGALDYVVGRCVDTLEPPGGPCTDCGAREGELHGLGCLVETCPTCGGQAVTCEHCYTPVRCLPRKPFLAARVPHIDTPATACARCLRPEPGLFVVSDEAWHANVPAYLRDSVLCRECYELIAGWTKAARDEGAAP